MNQFPVYSTPTNEVNKMSVRRILEVLSADRPAEKNGLFDGNNCGFNGGNVAKPQQRLLSTGSVNSLMI